MSFSHLQKCGLCKSMRTHAYVFYMYVPTCLVNTSILSGNLICKVILCKQIFLFFYFHGLGFGCQISIVLIRTYRHKLVYIYMHIYLGQCMHISMPFACLLELVAKCQTLCPKINICFDFRTSGNFPHFNLFELAVFWIF